MNGEFVQGGYNKYEHDYSERSDEKLQEQAALYAESRNYSDSGPRREQIDRTLAHIAFELSERLREARNEEIEQAWREKEIEDGILET